MINEKVQPKIKTLIFTHLNVMTNLNDVFTVEHKRRSFVLKDSFGLMVSVTMNRVRSF